MAKNYRRYVNNRVRLRSLTILILLGFVASSIVMPPVSVYADTQTLPEAVDPSNSHIGRAPEGLGTPMAQNYPGGSNHPVSKLKAATDARPTDAKALSQSRTPAITGEQLGDTVAKPRAKARELVEKRSATSTTTVNTDGSISERRFFSPQFYKKDGKWTDIDTTLVEDKNAGDSGNIIGKAYGNVQSWLSSPTNFKVEENDWQARFSPSNSGQGMVRIKKGNDQIGFKPVGAKDVAPVIGIDKDGKQTVHYYDLWPGVNVEYVVESAALKENIIIKNKAATNKVSFELLGATLEKKQPEQDERAVPYYAIKGALQDKFAIAPANLILNNFGFVTEEGVFSQTYTDGKIVLSVDKEYLQKLPARAFPAVIDPGVFDSGFGNRQWGNYVSFNNDGYVCQPNVCNLYAGTLYDSWSNLKDWRGAFFVNYDQFKDPSRILTNATLHLTQRQSQSFWTGDSHAHTYYITHAPCFNNFYCNGSTVWGSGTFASAGDINLTDFYDSRINVGDFNAWIMVMDDETSDHSFKNFDPENSYITFYYGGAPPAPGVSSPVANQTFVDPQPSFKVSYVSNPNSSTVPLQYEMLVSSGSGASGALVASGRLSAQQWTMPDGILEDGSTYYIQVRTYDPVSNTVSEWSSSVPFRIDMRTGKDKTQTYNSLGPVDVDLATGNVATSTASHTMSALGGSIGVSLDYNSPLKSRNGLVGKYWNNDSFTGSPVMTRVDQNMHFQWGAGSPSNATVPNDYFSVRWEGYFTAPQTGTYQFGTDIDDGCRLWVDNTQLINSWAWCGAQYASGITLNAGDIVPIKLEYRELYDDATVLLKVKGVVDPAGIPVPTEWLQTGIRPVATRHGLTGSYYGKFDGTNTFSSGNTLIMKRIDPYLNFDWFDKAPITNGPSNFLVRWTGYVTVPTTGTYNFGVRSDDGAKITIGTSNTIVYNEWLNRTTTESYGTGFFMTANTPTPITVEYFDNDNMANFQLRVQGAVSQQIVPSDWLTPNAQVLPEGWNLGIDPDGSLSYDRLKANQNSVVLTDSTGSTHEYTWTGSGYKPPVNEDGNLVRNGDGSYTLLDVDGRTYVFAADGSLSSVTSAIDDRKPAALQYEYQSLNGGPPHLYRIKDGVDTNRYLMAYYSGEAECGSAPSGFDANAPTGMLCAVKTTDNRTTYLYYVDGQLARIAEPGNEYTDYFYQAVQNNGVTIGYQLAGMRDALANDAIAAGVRTNDATAKTEVAYDILGRATGVTQPAATANANRTEHTVRYLPGIKPYVDSNGNNAPGYYGASLQRITGSSEPNGYSRRIEYDSLYRTTRDYDITANTTIQEWDTLKDLLLSTTDSTGLKSTTLYDDEDRPTDSYGPAPAAWYGTDRRPTTTYANQVPRSETKYDENIVGPTVAWHDYKQQAGNSNGALSGAPKLHTTGINTSTPGTLSYDFSSPPITAGSGAQGIGFSATGKLRLPMGTYTINADLPDGIRVWIDDKIVLDSWIDQAYRTTVIGTNFVVGDTAPKRIRIDHYRRTTSTGTLNIKIQQNSGFAYTTDWSSYLQPDYSLTTSTKVYDATLGNSTATTNYGSNPELGLAQSSSVDPTGLNLTTANTYETQGATGSLLRQTSKNLPGNPTNNPSFTYSYYSATDTRDNPCTTGTTEAFKQAGMLKFKTEADPDGTGSKTSRVTETIYDDAGRVVATRYNNDSWTCTTYDTRGRVSETYVPSYNGETARTISNDYAVGGNPLVTTTWDDQGWIVVWSDLLGRITKYRDVYDDETTNTYDNFGRLTQRVSPMGTEAYTYDTYNRLSEQKLDSVTYATVHYDTYNRIDYVDYNNASQMRMTLGRDTLGRTNSMTYRMGNGTTVISDTANRTQSGQVLNDIVAQGSNELWYTYGYDGADRLTSASVGANSYAYSFATQNSTTCGTGTGTNPNSGKNGNRTSQTINGTTTYFCYDYADRLIGSSNALWNGGDIDSHGNMTSVGTGTTPLRLCYDSSDRNTCMTQRNSSGTGIAMYYERDVQGRIVARYKNTLTNWTATAAGDWYYHYTGSGDTPDYVRDVNWAIVEKTLQLPGGINLTIKPLQTGNAQKQYSLPNIHGDTLLTADASGTNTSNGNGPANAFTYDPFGNVLSGSVLPANTSQASYGYVGQHEKLTESDFALTPIQMGARVYLPGIGRFLQVDPVEGGVDNNYVYPTDPVGEFDLDGMIGIPGDDYFTYSPLKISNTQKSAFEFYCGSGSEVISCFIPGFGQIKGAKAALKGTKMLLKASSKAEQIINEARKLGYKAKIAASKAPFDSHGQPVFRKGNKYITRDIDSHKGGHWKVFRKKGGKWVRETWNRNLTKKIGN